MLCKDCKHYSNYMGGTCLGWADMSETNAEADVGSCSRFCVKSDKESDYTPIAEEEYSEYDKDFDHYPF